MEGKEKRAKISLIVGIVLMIILAVGIVVEFYFFYVYQPPKGGDMAIYQQDLKAVMADDVMYLSDGFKESENLKIIPITRSYYRPQVESVWQEPEMYDSKICGEVYLQFDPKKIRRKRGETYNSENFKSRVKNIDLYKYQLQSVEEYDGIPVRVSVVGKVGKGKENYSEKLPNGDSYAILEPSLTQYMSGKGKSCEVCGVVGKSGVIEKYSRLKITVSVDTEKACSYDEKAIEERVDSVLSNALNYIEKLAK